MNAMSAVYDVEHGELNAYDDDESEYVDYDAVDVGTDQQLHNELLHGMFGDIYDNINPIASCHDDILVELMQRRLFDPSERQDERSKATMNTRQSLSSPQLAFREFLADGYQPHREHPYANERHPQNLSAASSPSPSRLSSSALSPRKVNHMLRRFRALEEQRARKIRAKRHEAESRETTGFSFAPAINDKSRRLVRHFPAFLERQTKHLTLKQQHRGKHQKAREEEQLRAFNLHANIKTPCICSRGNTSRSASCLETLESENKSTCAAAHTKSCLRFMEMCSKMNQSFKIQRKKEQMRRSIDDMMAYHDEKKRKQQVRAEVAQAQEAMNATFTPQINPTSEKIYATMLQSGRLQSGAMERNQKPRQWTQAQPVISFRPTICKKSKYILQKKYQRQPGAGSDCSPLLTDVFQRLQISSPDKSRMQNPVATEIDSSASSSRVRTRANHVPWIDVEYDDATCGFILQHFELPVAFA